MARVYNILDKVQIILSVTGFELCKNEVAQSSRGFSETENRGSRKLVMADINYAFLFYASSKI